MRAEIGAKPAVAIDMIDLNLFIDISSDDYPLTFDDIEA